ncbi:MAG TPA: DUF3014 domain-containing protein [Burkholderiaceae bacterium]|nr:DUF3014 domain-containing protein [Burkholderiaceae bacterium]
MNKSSLWLFIAAGVLAAGGLWFYFMGKPTPTPEPEVVTTAPPPPAAPAPAPAGPPPIEHPLPSPPADTPAQPPLPELAASDAPALAALKSLVGPQRIELFHTDELIRRFVATVDNLPREKAFTRLMPVKQVPGGFVVDREGERTVIGKANEARYTPYVRLAEAIDPRTAAAVYIHFYPLLQQQYRSLGYPDRYFNDRVIAAIDDMLAAPDVSGPVRLTQPRVLYQFEDPELEKLSAGRKIMIRMGPANAARVKQRLRLVRAELTKSPPPR